MAKGRKKNDGKFTHLDLFSGIGGFAIAAQESGFRTVAFCESDPRCRAFLEKRWGLPVEPDVRKLDGRGYAGVSLLTGGPPCQPASRAGKQGGSDDDRWLWPEALRVLEEALPLAVVFENPLGIGDVGLDGILSEMGRIGYEVQIFDIPACAVDSPQLRHRYWIVGFASGERAERKRESRIVAGASGQVERETQERERRRDASRYSSEDGNLADAESRGLGADGSASRGGGHVDERGENRCVASSRRKRSGENESGRGSNQRAVDRRDCENKLADTERERRERGSAESSETEGRQSLSSVAGLHWQNSIWVPCADGKLRRAPDNSFMLVDGVFSEVSGIMGSRPHRSILGALGNSIVPALAKKILVAVRLTLETHSVTIA